MAYATETRERARALRLAGMKIETITGMVGVLSSSTITEWTRDLPRPENRQGRRRSGDRA